MLWLTEEAIPKSTDLQNKPTASSLMQKGESYVIMGDTAAAVACFKYAVRINRDLADAHHRLAQLYLGIGGLDNRIKARWALEKALRLEPDNITYLYTQVHYFNQIEAMGSVERTTCIPASANLWNAAFASSV